MAETLHQMAMRMCVDACSCWDCPIGQYNRTHRDNNAICIDVVCAMVVHDGVEKQIAILRRWAKENPPKEEEDDD